MPTRHVPSTRTGLTEIEQNAVKEWQKFKQRERDIEAAKAVKVQMPDLKGALKPFQNQDLALHQARQRVSTKPSPEDRELLHHVSVLDTAIKSASVSTRSSLAATKKRIEVAINKRRIGRELQKMASESVNQIPP